MQATLNSILDRIGNQRNSSKSLQIWAIFQNNSTKRLQSFDVCLTTS